MDENLTDELDILSDGTDATQFPESGTWGEADGTTIISFDPTPSPTPYPDNDNNISEEKIDELIVALEENTKAQENPIEDEGVNTEDSENSESQEEAGAEIVYTIDDIYEKLESIEGILQDSNDTAYIHYKNSELILTFILGFTVAFFASFILYCFIGRIK